MDVMMNMTTEDVRVLREKFTGKMSLEQFVVLLKNTLHDRIHSELDFVVGVVELFHTIDVNGDEFLDWDEFAGYMMDAGQAKSDFYFEDLRQKKCYQHMPLPLCDDKTPMNSIRSYIQQMLYMHEQNAIAYFEHDSDVVYLYGLHFDRNDGPRHLSTLRLHTAFQEHTIICMAYVATKKLLVISSMLFMGYLSVWCVADLHSPAMVHRVESQCPHEQLTWVPSLQCLLTAAVGFPAISKKKNSRDGYRPNAAAQTYTKLNQLLRWDLVGKTLVSTEFVLKDRLKGVSALETFKCINRTHIAIGSEDGVLIVVDAESWETVSSFDAHGNGVKMLCYSVHVESLASAGFHSYSDETTLHISIWKKKGAAGHLVFETSLKHHDAPVELINFVDSKRQLISLDAGGTFKVYSSVLLTPTSEPWECLQSSQVAPTPTEPNRILSCFVVPETVASDAVLVTAGRTVAFYDLCEVKDREEVFYAHYCQSLNLIMGVTISKVLFWNAETGRLWKAYEYAAILAASTDPAPRRNTSGPACDLGNPRTITAVCMDDRERKVILGDDAGSLKVINAVNGNIMKELDPHHQAISSISYVLHGKRVVSISIDSSLHIYDENNPLGYYVPFRGSHPQSVLLQSLRFLPETQPFSMHCRKQRAKDANEPDWESSHSSVRAPVMTEKFEIVKSIGNQALNKVAVLISGSRGESFVQVWSFDMSHTQGTCIAPRNDEITNICFFGSSADILGGTSSGCMLLWLVSKDDGAYYCSMELQCLSELEQSIENSHVPSLLHMFAYERAATTNQTSSSRSEEDASKEASSTFSLTDLKEQTSSYPNRCSKDGEQTTQESEGMHIFAGDDQGFVSVWFVPHHHVNDAKSTTSVHLLASNDATSETATSATNSSATVMFQHEEMVLGYDAIAGLYMRALEKNHAEAMPQSNPTGRYPSLTRREKKASSQRILAPRLRWRAHSGPILCLNFAIDPLVALTSSTRGRIKVWSFDGELLGILDDFASRRKPVTQPWCFPVDMTERRRRKEHAAQQFLEKSKGLFRRNKQARMSIMQERLSLSHEELTFNYTAEKKTIQSRRHSRWSNIQVRGSDVTRAIRKFILKQAALAQGSPTPSALRRNGTNHEPSLQVVLKEIDQLQLQTSARGAAGENNPSLIRKKYPCATVTSGKALRPRTTSNTVHCEFAQAGNMESTASASKQIRRHMPPLDVSKASVSNNVLFKPRRKEIYITSTSPTNLKQDPYALQVSMSNAYLTLRDIRDESVASGCSASTSNQEVGDGTNSKNRTAPSKAQRAGTSSSATRDPVLKYHVKLAHSWQQYQVHR